MNKAEKGYLQDQCADLETIVTSLGTLESMVSFMINLNFNFFGWSKKESNEVTSDLL
jgi:hypothetical protein